jgi:YVTN family beta-propeller protein
MPVSPSRLRRVATVTAACAAGASLLATGTAQAHGKGQAPGKVPAPKATVAPLAAGLYQSAYSERNHVLWATTAVGRPPVTQSALLKVDPATLAVKAAYEAPVTDATTGARQAVYGVAVDDEHNTVWTTNTRNNSVSVYSQRTGTLLATVENVEHSRDIVVDEAHDTVWASGFGAGTLVAIDSKTFKEKKRVTVEGAGPTGLAVNERTGAVYAADLNNDRIIEVGRGTSAPRLLPTGQGPIAVSLSKDGRTAYTANQTGGDLSVVDLRKGVVTTSVPTGDGPLSVATDTRTGNVLVANRTAATVSVVNPRQGEVVDTVPVNANPNHVEIHGGSAYVVDKSGAVDGKDTLTRIRLSR